MEVKEYTMKVEIIREMFYSEDSYFGIYAAKPVVKSMEKEVQMNSFGNFSLNGNTRPLIVGNEYVVTFDGAHPNKNPNYDDFYQIKQVEPEKLSSAEDQDRFLKAVITEKQYESLKSAYSDVPLVDYILEDKIDVSKTKGIKEATLANIKHQVQINAEVSILIAKLDTLNLSTNSINRIMEHYKSGQVALDAIEENIYNLCSIKGYGFLTVDKVALERGDSPTNSQRIEASFNYILKAESQSGHTWLGKESFLEKSQELLNIDIEPIVSAMNTSESLYIDDSRVALKYIRNQEKSIFDNLQRIHSTYLPQDLALVKNRLDEFEVKEGITLTNQQNQAVLDSSQQGISVVNGSAGSGKSLLIKAIIESSGINPSHIMTCALSGKASNVLSSRGVPSSTIHRMLGYDGSGFKYDGSYDDEEDNRLPYSLIIIDEMSMVDVWLLLSVVKAVKEGGRVVLVGDNVQLSSVGYGDVLQNLLESSAFPSYELTEIHRQAAKSGVLELATKIRNGKYSIPYNSSGKETFGDNSDQAVITYTSEAKGNIRSDALKIIANMKKKLKSDKDLLDFQVLVSNRESGQLSTKNMNIEIQKILNGEESSSISRSGYDYKVGDKVISNGNLYGIKLYESLKEYVLHSNKVKSSANKDEELSGNDNVYNGTLGIVKELDIKEKVVLVQYEGFDELVAYSSSDLDKISLAYAITIHKSQGSSASNVLVCLDFSSYMMLSMNLVYTAITRSSDKCVLLAESGALSTALGKKSNTRRTFLKEFLDSVVNDK